MFKHDVKIKLLENALENVKIVLRKKTNLVI